MEICPWPLFYSMEVDSTNKNKFFAIEHQMAKILPSLLGRVGRGIFGIDLAAAVPEHLFCERDLCFCGRSRKRQAMDMVNPVPARRTQAAPDAAVHNALAAFAACVPPVPLVLPPASTGRRDAPAMRPPGKGRRGGSSLHSGCSRGGAAHPDGRRPASARGPGGGGLRRP